MKGSPVRYGVRFGCRFGQPHDFAQVRDTPSFKVERCRICRLRKKYNKDAKGRTDNPEYLRDHVRQFCQETGSTRGVFAKLYRKEKTIIHL